MHRIFLLFPFILLIFCSCSFNPNIPQTGADFLQGTWTEDSIENKDQLVSYEKFDFKFTCDSFYLKSTSFSTVNLDGGECYNANTWEEYAKGFYTFAKDTLILNGVFVNKDFRFKPQSSCYRFGKLEEKFLVKKQGPDTIIINSTLSHLKHMLVLKEKTTCDVSVK
jgi:hypothetical protein